MTALYDHVLAVPNHGLVFLSKPSPMSARGDRTALERYRGTYVHVASGTLATFIVTDGALMLERAGQAMSLIPCAAETFYAEVSETQRLPVAFVQDAEGHLAHAVIGGQPYHRVAFDPLCTPDWGLWHSFAGVYKDPSNRNAEEVLTVRVHDGMVLLAEGSAEVACQPLGQRCFVSDHGMIEFEGAHADPHKVLVWGKATRYYPVDRAAWYASGVITYLILPSQAAQDKVNPDMV